MWWKKVSNWDEKLIIKRLNEIQSMDWIQVSDWLEWTKKDDGQIGQTIERMFNVDENNDELPDLPPIYELKTLRKTSSMWTLKHRSKSCLGMTAREIFNKYSYPKDDRPEYNKLYSGFGYRDFSEPLLCDSKCFGKNGRCGHYFSLRSKVAGELEIHHRNDGFVSTIDLKDVWGKINTVIFINVETKNGTGHEEESFRLESAHLLNNISSPDSLLRSGILRCEFSMSQGDKYYPAPHDRGHHFRMSVPKIIEEKERVFKTIWSTVKRLI